MTKHVTAGLRVALALGVAFLWSPLDGKPISGADYLGR
jgi:hypothetical protein